MKDFIVVVFLIMLVFISGYYTEQYLKSSGKEIINMLKDIENEIKTGDMDNIEKVEQLRERWDDEQSLWNILSSHQNTDEVQREIEMLITNYQNKEIAAALINLTEIKSIVEDVPKGEKIAWVNIF